MAKPPENQNRRTKNQGTIETRKRKDGSFTYIAKMPDGFRLDCNGNKVTKYKKIKTCSSRAEAERILQNYNNGFVDSEFQIATFEELYNCWLKEYRASGYSKSSIRTVECAYSYCWMLYKVNIHDIGPEHIHHLIDNAYTLAATSNGKKKKKAASANMKCRIKSLCNLLFDYAVERSILEKNPARAFKIKKLLAQAERNRKETEIICLDAIETLWKYKADVPNSDMVLIALYTGLRPQELATILVENVDLSKRLIIAGMKTANGINRKIPIHPAIHDLISNRLRQATDYYHSPLLFNDRNGQRGIQMTYDKYRKRFAKVMNEIGYPSYTPECTRHTFATYAQYCKINEGIRKRIMGHSVANDVTEHFYTHPSTDYLYKEICKLTYCPEYEAGV